MGIFKRVKTITKAEINGFLDGFEDPIAMLNEYSRELEQELVKGQKALARQIFAENKMAALISETRAVVEKRTRQAKLAIEREEESMAKLAVQEKLLQEKQLILYQDQFAALKEQTQELKNKLEQLKVVYNELQQKKIVLASRANVALSMKQIQNATVSFQTDTIAQGMARAEDKILMMEAEVQARSQVFGSVPPQSALQGLVDEEELKVELDKLKNQ